MKLSELVEQAKIGNKDYEAQLKSVARVLHAMDPNEILGLHEEVLAEAWERVLSFPPNGLLMAAYDTRCPPPTSHPFGTPNVLKRIADFSELQMTFHAYMVLCGYSRLESSQTESFFDGTISHGDLTDEAWFNARMGSLILHDIFPIAYEIASGSMWPRSIRGPRSQKDLIEFVNPISYSASRSLPGSLRAYWSSLDEAVRVINDSEEWWAWLRGTDWRTLELDCGTRDWWSVKRKTSGKFSGTQRRPLKVKLTGRSAKIGLTPNENEIFLMSKNEADIRTKEELHELISFLSNKYDFPLPPPIGS